MMSRVGRAERPGGRSRPMWLLVGVFLGVAVPAAGIRAGDVIRLPESGDAWLEDVFFVDPDQGWCVGREGVIWGTRDGGRHWNLQHAEPGVHFHRVFFLDSLRGWAVGGRVHPVTWRTSAVILKTTSGGRRWTPVKTAGLAELHGIHFFSPRVGVAYGNPSTIYPTGIVRTEDGGRSWIGVAGASSGQWLDAVWQSPHEATLIGTAGVARVAGGKLQAAIQFPGTFHGLRRLAGKGGSSCWLVGDGATLRHRREANTPWQSHQAQIPPAFRPDPMPGEPRRVTALTPDFHAVAHWQDHVWVAGAPGSFVLHSADGGRTWDVQRTGQTVPLSDLCFVDEQHGWAVGALGTILATRDGGRSWVVQRRGGQRLALWGIHRNVRRLPLPLLSYFSSQEGWLTGAMVMAPMEHSPETLGEAGLKRRLAAAAGVVGATAVCVSERFPIVEAAGQVCMPGSLQVWQQRYGNGVEQVWLDYLRWQFAQWRPDVVCFGNYAEDTADSLDHFIHRTLLQLGQHASGYATFPARLRAWGLEPWRPPSIIELTPSRRRAGESMPITQLMPLAYNSVSFHAWPAQLYLTRRPWSWPPRIGWRVARQLGPRQHSRRLLADDRRSVRGVTRRESPQITLRLDRINQVAQSLRGVQEAVDDPSSFYQQEDWQGRLQVLLRDLPPHLAGQVVMRLCLTAAVSGDTDVATRLARQLGIQFPGHSLHEASLWWLLRHSASEETRVYLEVQRSNTQDSETHAVRPASHLVPEPDEEDPLPAWTRLTGEVPEFVSNPLVALPASARLRKRVPEDSQAPLRAVAGAARPRWARLAKGELWLIERRGSCPVPRISAPRSVRPHLDGDRNEPLWKQAAAVALTPRSVFLEESETTVRVALDANYLYLFATCAKPPNRAHRAITPRSARDQADRQIDHLMIQLDIDRDYSTAFQLVIDSRGWVSDLCSGDTRWNPEWFVAAKETPREWRIECALPWRAISAGPPTAQSPIALRIVRSIPGQTEMVWPQPSEPSWGWLVESPRNNLSEDPTP